MFTKLYAKISVFYTNPNEIILKYSQLFLPVCGDKILLNRNIVSL